MLAKFPDYFLRIELDLIKKRKVAGGMSVMRFLFKMKIRWKISPNLSNKNFQIDDILEN